jgi:hypothetical protein
MTRTGLFLSALGVAASACQATHAEASRPATFVPPPVVTTTTTTSHTVASAPPPPPPQNVCVAIDKSKYELPPLETHVGTVATLPPLPPVPAIVDDSHDLAPFYAKLARLARGKATDHVRIAVYGDSNMTMDYMTGAMRRLLQNKFGDGGHGYVAMARPWAWYHHMDVKQELSESKWTKISTSTDHVRDGHYGLANVATESDKAGAWSMVGTVDDAQPIGSKVSAIDVFYMKRPGGGSFGIKVDGEQAVTLSSASTETAATWEHFDMPDGAHKLELVVNGGNVRLFGAALERSTPSIIIDSLGTGALNYEQMQHVSDASRDPMLKRRKYDLVVFLIGTNLFAPGLHERWMEKDIGMIEGAVPHTPILVLSPPDIELHQTDTHSDPRIVALQKQLGDIAKKHDWAYWNFWQAMGGDMSMIKFARVGLGTWDLVHLTRDGGFLMGDRFAHALFEGFEAYLKDHPDAGCAD